MGKSENPIKYLQKVTKRPSGIFELWSCNIADHNNYYCPVVFVGVVNIHVSAAHICSASGRQRLVGIKITINIDIDLPYVPCDIISVDVEDIIGAHLVDTSGKLNRHYIDAKGNIIEAFKAEGDQKNMGAILNRVVQMMEMNRGCKLKGNLIVNKVNGNFHISSHAFPEVFLILQAQGKVLDFSHKINHLSFGSEESISKIKSITGGWNLSPLDKLEDYKHRSMNMGDHFHNTHTSYFLDIIPTKYMIGDDEEYSAHEFTYSFQTLYTHGMSEIFFQYELSPIFITYKVTQESFFEFFIRCCAILGCVYTVAGIIENLFLETVDTIKGSKKVEHGPSMEKAHIIE